MVENGALVLDVVGTEGAALRQHNAAFCERVLPGSGVQKESVFLKCARIATSTTMPSRLFDRTTSFEYDLSEGMYLISSLDNLIDELAEIERRTVMKVAAAVVENNAIRLRSSAAIR